MRRQSTHRGFTLVELTAIVGFFFLLALLVAPQFASASSVTMKDSIRWDLGRISDAMWAYEREHGEAPAMGDGVDAGGWGALLTDGYLQTPPLNPYVGSARIDSGQGQLTAGSRPTGGEAGWGYYRGDVFAVGYDATMNLLSFESGYEARPVGLWGSGSVPGSGSND